MSFILCLILVQPRKRPDITTKQLTYFTTVSTIFTDGQKKRYNIILSDKTIGSQTRAVRESKASGLF